MKKMMLAFGMALMTLFWTKAVFAIDVKAVAVLRVLSYEDEENAIREIFKNNKKFSPREVMIADTKKRSADADRVGVGQGAAAPSFMLGERYFSTGVVTYVPQRFPGDTCEILTDEKMVQRGFPRYPRRCAEGQIRYEVCDLMVVDAESKVRAIHHFNIPDGAPGYPSHCMGSIGYGVGSRQTGSLLMTLQYHHIHTPPASKTGDFGKGWMQTTRLLRIQEHNGELVVTEDNRCLGENNRVPDIPSARKLLKQCPLDMQ